MNEITNTETTHLTYKSLYRLGGAAAWIAALLTLSEVIVFAFYPQPVSIADWFRLFQSHRLLGLLDFWALEVLLYAMFTIVFLALYHVLKKEDAGLMAIALSFALLGIGVFFATNNPFAMLSLSDQYAAATTDAQKAALLAAGQAVLTNTSQRAIGGFNMGLFLVSIAGLMISTFMFRNPSFSRTTAYVGILANVLSLADYLRQALTSSVVIALLVILPNALLLVLWYVLVGRRLHQLGYLERKSPPNRSQSRTSWFRTSEQDSR